MLDVTIGIPVYNSKQYIRRCLNSVLEQTFLNIDFLIVDDGSNDNTLDLVYDIKNNHSRGEKIRIIKNLKNIGVSETRNIIINNALGKYLFFLDSDDFISTDCIEKLYKVAEENNSEVVLGSYSEKSEMSDLCKNHINPIMILKGEDKLALFANQNLHQNLRSFIWNILFDANFLRKNNLKFEDVNIWEDLLFSIDYIPLVKNAALISDLTYTYFKRSGSLSKYEYRPYIPSLEIKEHLQVRYLYKDKCIQLLGKPYFDILISKAMKVCFDTACIIVLKRDKITPFFPINELMILLKHPLSYQEIFNLKKYRIINILFKTLALLPKNMVVFILFLYVRLTSRYKNI